MLDTYHNNKKKTHTQQKKTYYRLLRQFSSMQKSFLITCRRETVVQRSIQTIKYTSNIE